MASSDLERLQQLMSQSSLPPGPPPDLSGGGDPPPPKRKGGLLDFIAVVLAIYTLVVTTPVGGLLTRMFNWGAGTSVRVRPLITYFETSFSGERPEHRPVEVQQRLASVVEHAKEAELDVNLGQALALALAHEGQIQNGAYDVRLTAAGQASFVAVELKMPSLDVPAHQRQRVLLRGIPRLAARLGGFEAAVAATTVEMHRVAYAVNRARGAEVKDPTAYAAFRDYLAPADRRAADGIVSGTFALATAFGMAWPVAESARVSSPFGWRIHPVLGTRKRHTGVDFAVGTGTPIAAVAAGQVRYAGQDSVNGQFVKVDHGHGLTTAYCHASKLLVTRGETVEKGQQVALSGASGRVSGPHLHFQMELHGQPIDPELFRSGGTGGESLSLPHAPSSPKKASRPTRPKKAPRRSKAKETRPSKISKGAPASTTSTVSPVPTSSSARSTPQGIRPRQ